MVARVMTIVVFWSLVQVSCERCKSCELVERWFGVFEDGLGYMYIYISRA